MNISIIEIMFQNYVIFHMNYVLKVCFDARDVLYICFKYFYNDLMLYNKYNYMVI